MRPALSHIEGSPLWKIPPSPLLQRGERGDLGFRFSIKYPVSLLRGSSYRLEALSKEKVFYSSLPDSKLQRMGQSPVSVASWHW